MATEVSSSSVSLGDAGKTKVQSIGTVKAVTGEAIVINASGVACTLKPGDKVFPNDIIQTSELGSVQIEFSNGQLADLGRTTSFLIDKDIYDLKPQKALALNEILSSAGNPVSGGTEAAAAAESARIAKLFLENGSLLADNVTSAEESHTNRAPTLTEQHGYGFVQLEAIGNTSGVQTGVDPTVASYSQPLGTDKKIVSGNAIQTGINVGFETSGATSPLTTPAGNQGQTPVTTVFADTSPPGRATVAINSYINDSTPTINGSAEPGSSVNIIVQSAPQYFTTRANPNGSWTIQIPEDGAHDLEDGQHTITVQVVDAAGNVSETVVIPFTVDTIAPEGNFTISTSGRTGDNTPVISGTAEAGSFIRVTLTGTGTAFVTTTDMKGNWSVESPSQIADGSYTVTATATDLAGNSASRVVSLTVDTTAPSVHVVTVPPVSEGANSPVTVLATDTIGSNEAILTITPPNPLPAGVTFDPTAKTFTLNPADQAFQTLNANELREVTVTYTVSDGINSTQASIVFEVLGVNDAPVASTATASGNEDAIITGHLSASDPDAGATLTYTLDAPVAGLTLNSDGSYSFDAGNAAYQSLAAGATNTVVANYTVTDGQGGSSSSTLTIGLIGTNDAPVATVATASASEDATITGTLAATDPDAGATLTYALVTPVAGLTINSDGSYSFDAGNAAYQSLAAGATTTVVANYTVTDGQGASSASTATITINGTNDAATVSSADVTLAETNAALTTSGTLTSSDVDNPANAFTAATIVGTLGTFAIDAAGAWTFTANSAFDSLNAGGNVNETFAVHSADGTASSVKITINGTNDAPTVAAALSGSAAEGASPVNFNLLSGAGDADQGEAATLSVSTITYSVDGVPTVSAGTAVPAGITLNGNTLTVDPTNAAFNHLAFSQSMVIAVAFHVVDAQGVFVAQTQTVTVTGTNDAPVITVGTGDSAAATLTETNAGLTASGTVTLLDVDTSDLVTASVSSVVASGHITGLVPDNATLLNYLTLGSPVDTSGTTGGPITWNFNSGSEAFNYLAAGESLTLTYVIAVNDGKGGTDTQDITLTINGSTDSATVTAISSSTGIDPQVIEDFLTANNIDLSAYEIYYDNNGNNAGQDIWVGSMATDSITGGNRDVLIGGTGNDTLGTSGGSTIIWGGPGDDAMTGGASGDKFVYMRGDLAGTVIGDTIDVGNGGGDVIDLRDLLDSTGVTGTVTQGATANDAQVSYQTTTGSGVLSISINPTDKTVVISVDTDGGSASFQTLATVEGLVRNNPPSATALLTDLLGNSNSLQIDL